MTARKTTRKQQFSPVNGCHGAAWLAILGMIAWTGCGGSEASTYPAGGTVKFPDGQPLAGGMVLFRSVDRKPPAMARGHISATGEFELTTFSPGDGAVLGQHEALITPPLFLGDRDDVRVVPEIIDRKFRDYTSSNLKFEVTSNSADNRFDIIVQRPGR